ncbi:MAG: 1-deoxy-D-xylulose-5-phosphate synthase [Mariprofundales bacterium]
MTASMTPLLESIHCPDDVKHLSIEQLVQLASDMREYMVTTLAPIGGHVGAGLGVVELSIALHYIFNSPTDAIVWDVGHQAYPHKMLTGRMQQLPSIRQYGGLSGFTKRSESDHDPFGAGHACTSISAAYGMAVAKECQGQQGKCIAIIGDGGLSGGMAFEALNHAGAHDTPLLVILNDNEMSIAPNVGAMSAYLARIITGKTYVQLKSATQKVLGKVPLAYNVARRVEEHVKGMITPGTLFEELGFRYIGPIDGHDFEHLLPTLSNCSALDTPILLHVITRKGFGFAPAEEDPETWHGLGPYNAKTGKAVAKSSLPTYTDIFSTTLLELAEKDERIVAITAAMPGGTGLSKFAEKFPQRFFDVGIAEQHAVTFAAGLATAGLRPVVAIYSTFLQRGFDQVAHDVCLQGLPVIFAIDRAGIVGADGATHTGAYDIAYLRCLPNIIMMAPKDGFELDQMLQLASTLDQPVAIRYPRGMPPEHRNTKLIPVQFGKGEVIISGKDALIVSIGSCYTAAQEAVQTLVASDNISITLINLRFIKPLDIDLILAHLTQNQPLLVTEEGSQMGGIGEHILSLAVQSGWRGSFAHIAIPDIYPAHGEAKQIKHDLNMDAAAISKSLRSLLMY